MGTSKMLVAAAAVAALCNRPHDRICASFQDHGCLQRLCQVQPGRRCWPLHDVQGYSGRCRGSLQGLLGVQGRGEVYSALSCLVTSFLYRPKVYNSLTYLMPCLCCLD